MNILSCNRNSESSCACIQQDFLKNSGDSFIVQGFHFCKVNAIEVREGGGVIRCHHSICFLIV
jgi:hypothetical protein